MSLKNCLKKIIKKLFLNEINNYINQSNEKINDYINQSNGNILKVIDERLQNNLEEIQELKKIQDIYFQKFLSESKGDTPHEVIQKAINRIQEITKLDNFTKSFYTKKEFDSFLKSNKMTYKIDNSINKLLSITFNEDVELYEYRGYCSVCNKEVLFTNNSIFTCHTEGMVCPSCHLNSRLRLMYNLVKEKYSTEKKVYICEYVTDFFNQLKSFIPDIVGSEYLEENDKRREYIHHEDVENLTFDNSSFDIVISNDVLEHVFDYKKAFKETARVLKDGGVFLFHIPFYNHEKTIIRAKKNEKGIKFLEEPIYHGNPVSNKGALWINDFGWDIFNELKEAGFKDSYLILNHSYISGFMNDSALLFIAEK